MQRTTDDGGINLVIFDADDDCKIRRTELLDWKRRTQTNFELFLFPNNKDEGELENLLEQIINPENKQIMECWDNYEQSLKEIHLPWRNGIPLTIPAKKPEYTLTLKHCWVHQGRKKKNKRKNRDYQNKKHWNLNAEALSELTKFLKSSLSQ